MPKHKRTNFKNFFFFFNDPATPEIYPLSLHDALPISPLCPRQLPHRRAAPPPLQRDHGRGRRSRVPQQKRRRCGSDRKSTRLNSSHLVISYAVFCLKKKRNVCETIILASL